ncbi:MAG: hypothetical protein WDZ62_00535 [Candidatus Pacearchaeota archaeon]
MVEYSINLSSSQREFISENYDTLFFLDKDIYVPPKMTEERIEELELFYNSFNDITKENLRQENGINGPFNPLLNKILRGREILQSKKEFDLNSRSNHIIRSLYGIIGFQKIRSTKSWRYFHNYFIPKENLDATKKSLVSGQEFNKEFHEGDLEILEVIYKRNFELRMKGINHRYPLFYISEVAKRSDVKRESAEKSLFNLIGVLGFCLEKEPKYWAKRWFVPKSREDLVKKLIS